ncbi:MAG: hypothetical protein ACR2M1_02525 [Gemmatimonadaceae bacterium]
MTIRRLFTRSCASAPICITTAVLILLACGSSVPHAVPQEVTVQIQGEFLADGSCRVTADGVPLFPESDRPRTIYLRGRALNMAPSGYDMHEIWCAPVTASEPMLPDKPKERAFFINVYPPTGKLAVAQHYIVVRGIPRSSGSATALRANISLFGHDTTTNGGASQGPGTTYLTGAGGDVTLTQVDSVRVVGTFRALGVRETTM